MIRTLKLLNAALWGGLAAVGLGGLPLLPLAHRLVGMEAMPFAAAAALAATAAGSAWGVRRRAHAGLRRRIDEAERLAGEGFPEEAAEILAEALSRLESAPVSAGGRRGFEREIRSRLARLLRERPEAPGAAWPRRRREEEPRDRRVAEHGFEPGEEEPPGRIGEARRARPEGRGPIAETSGAPAEGRPSARGDRRGEAATGPRASPVTAPPEGGAEPREGRFRFPASAVGFEEEGEEPPPMLWGPGTAFRAAGEIFGRGRALLQGLFSALRAAVPPPRPPLSRPRRRLLVLSGLALAAAFGLAAGVWVAIESLSGSPVGEPLSGVAAPPAGESLPAALQPYTLQVAAYLKEETALRRVEELKQRGLDAYLSTAERGGKRWYQVRISHFADPQSAREAGRALREKGWIEDFYVANTVR
ncbi:MAG: SPOR domain-containing protein [Desulfobacterales bacterium]